MAAYTPLFLFDFTFFYTISGLDYTQLLFIGMVVILIDLYLHARLTKKNLLLSLPFTLFLIGGIGLRISTSHFSTSLLFHYLVFSTLLLVLIIDHRIYLTIPSDFTVSVTRTNPIREQIPRPKPERITATPSTIQKASFKRSISMVSSIIHNAKQIFTAKIRYSAPQPLASTQSHYPTPTQDNITLVKEKTEESVQYIHPVEKYADNISTTKQLLNMVGKYGSHLDSLDKKIDNTTVSDKPFQDPFDKIKPSNLFENDLAEVSFSDSVIPVDFVSESAVILSRGIVKSVNSSFSDLLNRPMSDIIDHDFI